MKRRATSERYKKQAAQNRAAAPVMCAPQTAGTRPFWSARLMFTLAPFWSAMLLFSVQPMMAKFVLPEFGGAAAVWTTCMMFYQGVLLLGYAYADRLTRQLSMTQQAVVHTLLVLVPLLQLPFGNLENWYAAAAANPVLSLLRLLVATVGLPFLALSATAPMLQAWFARTKDPRARDPYFLYAASNAGSVLGLLGYLLLIEPSLGLRNQSLWWAGGYVLHAIFIGGCGLLAIRGGARPAGEECMEPSSCAPATDYVGRRGKAYELCLWLVYAFVPSSLMLSITAALTSDVAPFPFMWVIPLVAYLLSFIVAFSGYTPRVRWVARIACPVALCLQVFLVAVPGVPMSVGLSLALRVVAFFVIALYFHGELASLRPAVHRLTRYYLIMSAGGALGGVFNSVLAPQWFSFHAELPLVLVLAALLVGGDPLKSWRESLRFVDRFSIVVIGSLGLQSLLLSGVTGMSATLCYGLTLLVALPLFVRAPYFATSLSVVLTLGFCAQESHVVYRERSFYGVSRVKVTRLGDAPALQFYHGSTLHGAQLIHKDRDVRCTPLTFYFRSSPIGQVFRALERRNAPSHAAILGLGAGTLASYATPGADLTFYEIDPVVARIASDPQTFTYLSDCRGTWRVVLGDGRLSLKQAADGFFDLLVCDAFSGDAIPTHLLTVEALQLYLQKCSAHGLLVFHVSNLYVDLRPVLARAAQSLGLVCRVKEDRFLDSQTVDERRLKKEASTWIVLARTREDFGDLGADVRWRPVRMDANAPLWTDDATSLWPVLHWRQDWLD